MALETQTVHVPVMSGVQEGSDPLNLPRGALLVGKNIRFTKDGACQKRNGYTLLSSPTAYTGGWGVGTTVNTGEGRLVANGERLLLVDGRAIHQYARGAQTWSTKCLAPRFTGTSKARASTNKVIPHADQATVTNTFGRDITVVAYCEQESSSAWGGGVYARAYDVATGAEVNTTNAGSLLPDNTYQLNSAATDMHNVVCVPVGVQVAVFYARVSTSNIYYRVLSCDTMVWGAEVAIVSDNLVTGGCSNRFDAKVLGTGISIVYQTSGFLVTWKRLSVAGTVLTAAAAQTIHNLAAGSDVASGFGVTPKRAADNFPTVWVTYGAGPGGGSPEAFVRGITVATDTVIGAASTTVDAYVNLLPSAGDYVVSSCSAVDPTTTTRVRLGYTVFSGYDSGNAGSSSAAGHAAYYTGFYRIDYTAPTTVVVTDLKYFLRAKLVSNPFESDSRWFCVVQRETGFHVANSATNIFGNSTNAIASTAANQGSTFVVDINGGHEDACFFPRQSFVWGDVGTSLFYVYRHVTQYVDPSRPRFCVTTFDALQQRCSVSVVTLSTDDKYRYHSYSTAEGVYLGGGQVGYMDGRTFSPCGTPFDGGYLVATAGAGAVSGSFAVAYEYSDNDGNVHRSPASSTLTFSNYLSPVSIRYPLQQDGWDRYNQKTRAGFANSDGNLSIVLYGGATADSMYELSRRDATPYDITGTPWFNTYGTFTVASSPSTAGEGKAPIYTQGGVLDHETPPASVGMTEYLGRLVCIDHTKRSLRFSNVIIPGERASFSDDFNLDIPFDAEAIFAVDGNCFIFGKDAIGVLRGYGPGPTGDGEGFPAIETVSTDVGCSDSRSIVRTPFGVMFQSAVGIHLLGTGGDVKLVSAPVQDTLATYPTITSAIQHPTETVVMFTCVSAGGSTGVRLVYDYRFDRWSVDELVGGKAIMSQAVVGTTVYLLAYDGNVYVESAATSLDNASWVTSEVVFASEKPAGAQALHRLRNIGLLGQIRSAADLTVSVAYDDASAYAWTKTFTNVTDAITEKQFYPARQMGRSFRVKFSDATPTAGTVGAGRGLSLSGIALTIGAYQGMNRLASGARK
jgi:hypothetical protein